MLRLTKSCVSTEGFTRTFERAAAVEGEGISVACKLSLGISRALIFLVIRYWYLYTYDCQLRLKSALICRFVSFVAAA